MLTASSVVNRSGERNVHVHSAPAAGARIIEPPLGVARAPGYSLRHGRPPHAALPAPRRSAPPRSSRGAASPTSGATTACSRSRLAASGRAAFCLATEKPRCSSAAWRALPEAAPWAAACLPGRPRPLRRSSRPTASTRSFSPVWGPPSCGCWAGLKHSARKRRLASCSNPARSRPIARDGSQRPDGH